jgi:hypothetical protein
MRTISLMISVGLLVALCSCQPQPRTVKPKQLRARTFNSGFPEAHDTYNGIVTGSDGRIYYILSTDSVDVGARMFVYDPLRRSHRVSGRHHGSLRGKGAEGDTSGQGPRNPGGEQRQAVFRHPHRLLHDQGGHGNHRRASAGLQALSGRTPPGLRYEKPHLRGFRRGAGTRGNSDHEHGHAPGPHLRHHLAHGVLLPLRSCAARMEEPRSVRAQGRKRPRRRVPHSLPFHRH